MKQSYGVLWCERGRPPTAGKLELLATAMRFEGRDQTREIPFDEIATIRIGRAAGDRVDGRPAVVLERIDGERISIGAVAQSILVGEIVDQVTEFKLREPENDEVCFLPTPGPGDSEGGDLY